MEFLDNKNYPGTDCILYVSNESGFLALWRTLAVILPNHDLVDEAFNKGVHRTLFLGDGPDITTLPASLLAEQLGLAFDSRWNGKDEKSVAVFLSRTLTASSKYVLPQHWEQAGGFSASLGGAWAVADSQNKERLAAAFPALYRNAQADALRDGSFAKWLLS